MVSLHLTIALSRQVPYMYFLANQRVIFTFYIKVHLAAGIMQDHLGPPILMRSCEI